MRNTLAGVLGAALLVREELVGVDGIALLYRRDKDTMTKR